MSTEFLLGHYLVLAVLVLGINLIPAFMPPTWMILAYFVVRFDLPLPGTVAIGATCATAGRLILASLSRTYLRPILPTAMKTSYTGIGKFIKTKNKLALPLLVLVYAFLPIPSNQVFMTMGLADLNTGLAGASFFLGRVISYTFWVSLANRVSDNISLIFAKHFENPRTYIVEIVIFVVIYALGQVLWQRVRKKHSTGK